MKKWVKLGCCGKEKKGHVRWVEYFKLKDCPCNMNDNVSFALGLTSLVCWGVSLVPQIFTNFKNKSAHGVSLAFLLTWLLGDICNLTGCILEPLTVGSGTFLVASATMPFRSLASTVAQVKFPGRKLLLENGLDNSSLGQSLGWLMAAIYISSPIPQICLNIKRGTVEGLNPLVFVICILAEASYAGSILARSREWEMIKADMPWLLDSMANLGLHLIIILQHIYYRYIKTNPEANKAKAAAF